MEELIKKHLGSNIPQWIIENCKALLTEWDSQKADTSDRQLTIPDVSNSVRQEIERRRDMILNEPDGIVREQMIHNIALDL